MTAQPSHKRRSLADAPPPIDARAAKVLASIPPSLKKGGLQLTGKVRRWLEDKNPLSPPPQMALFKMAMSYMSANTLMLAARVGLADPLEHGPRTSAEVARALDLHEEAVYRMMSSLSALGVFEELPGRTFALTPLSEVLLTNHPYSVRFAVAHLGLDSYLRAAADAEYTLRTGKPSFDKIHGMSVFEYLPTNPVENDMFNKGMTEFTKISMPLLLNAYDFSGIKTLVDVGGGHGLFLGTIVKNNPGMSGILYDGPAVTAGAPPVLASLGVADRVRIESGNFFEKVPAGADAYVIKNVLHDWDDDKVVQILAHCRQAMAPGGRVLAVDPVLEDDPKGQLLKQFTTFFGMLSFGSKERTESEFAALYARAGLKLVKTYRDGFLQGIMDGRAA